jgi:hypothetical protein
VLSQRPPATCQLLAAIAISSVIMPIIFKDESNNLVRSVKLNSMPKTMDVQVDGTILFNIGFVASVSYGLSGNYQFLHTVNNFIYLYAFGDRISTINISGLAAIKTCGEQPNKKIQSIYDFYLANRVGKKKEALKIVVGGDAGEVSLRFFGYLTGMTLDIKNSEPYGSIGFWNMRFEAVILG